MKNVSYRGVTFAPNYILGRLCAHGPWTMHANIPSDAADLIAALEQPGAGILDYDLVHRRVVVESYFISPGSGECWTGIEIKFVDVDSKEHLVIRANQIETKLADIVARLERTEAARQPSPLPPTCRHCLPLTIPKNEPAQIVAGSSDEPDNDWLNAAIEAGTKDGILDAFDRIAAKLAETADLLRKSGELRGPSPAEHSTKLEGAVFRRNDR